MAALTEDNTSLSSASGPLGVLHQHCEVQGKLDDPKGALSCSLSVTGSTCSGQVTQHAWVDSDTGTVLGDEVDVARVIRVVKSPGDASQSSCPDNPLVRSDDSSEDILSPPRSIAAAETAIFFDWDDTLLPTSFLADAAKICPPKGLATAGMSRASRPRNGRPRHRSSTQLPKDFPCFAALQRHAQLVSQLLTSARGLADRVAIVTLSERPWVFEAADMYLPGVNLKALLEDLKIPVYYAPEYRKKTSSSSGSEDECVACKRRAMVDFLEQAAGSCHNVLSIGDSTTERDAARLALRAEAADEASASPKPRLQDALCKTLKLMGDPSLKQLSDQLVNLAEQLPHLVAHHGNLDIFLDSPEDLTTLAFSGSPSA